MPARAHAPRVVAADGSAPMRRIVSSSLPPHGLHVVGGAATATRRLLVIASSTGGPRALATLLPALPCPLGLGTLIVQHMPAGFTAPLAARLDARSALRVREAGEDELIEPHTALLAPGGRHLRLTDDGRVKLDDGAAVGGLKPRADLLIADAAKIYGERLVLAVLTGMGADGKTGAATVKRHGGTVLVEAECTCTVYGMPRSIIEAGLADEVLPLDEMAATIRREAHA
jgi:two-component system chemotaxis response regulator CheB